MYKRILPALFIIACFASCDFFKKQDTNNNNNTADTLAVVKIDTLANTFLAYAFPQVLEANYAQIKETWKEEARKEEPNIHQKDQVNIFITYGKDSSWVEYFLRSDSTFTAIEGNVMDTAMLALVNDMVLDSIANRQNNLHITDIEGGCKVQARFAQDTISAFSFSVFLD